MLCYEVVNFVFADTALGLNNLSGHEGFINFVSRRRQTCFDHRLLRRHFVNSSVLEVRLDRGKRMWAVRGRLLADDLAFLDVSLPLRFEFKAAQELWLSWLVVNFVSCRLWEPLFLLSLLDVSGQEIPWCFLVDHILFKQQWIFRNRVVAWSRDALL